MNQLIRSFYYSMLCLKAKPERKYALSYHWRWVSECLNYGASYDQNQFLDKYAVKK